MRRRELLSAALLAAAAAKAQAQAPAPAAAAQFPGEEKLAKARREVSEAMAKVRLANSDAPDLLPRVRRRAAK